MTACMTDAEADQLAHVLDAMTAGTRQHGHRWSPMKVTTSLGAELTIFWSEENGGLYLVDFNVYWRQP